MTKENKYDIQQHDSVLFAAEEAIAYQRSLFDEYFKTEYETSYVIPKVDEANRQLTFIDLFAGCGGLSEGFYQAGYHALAHLEIDHYCCETLRERMRFYNYSPDEIANSVIEGDITSASTKEQLNRLIDGRNVDIIIGGPPCQAYSTAGRARDENGMKYDPRNFLFEHYVEILNSVRPKLFVFENVTGLLTATINGKKIVNQVFKQLGEHYNLMLNPKEIVLNTVNYGVPQERKRVIIIGVRKDCNLSAELIYHSLRPTHYSPEQGEIAGLERYVTVRDAIGDLPPISGGNRNRSISFSTTKNNGFLQWVRKRPNYELTDHYARTQNETDSERFRQMALNHWTFSELLVNRPDLRHPKQRVFSNSYCVQFYDSPARTIIAHLCKDGNQFIHPDPTQSRSISVREAARLQSFPDNFKFAGSMTQQFKQIGNAVPPLFAFKIALCLKYFLDKL